jgi:hypothetical protein
MQTVIELLDPYYLYNIFYIFQSYNIINVTYYMYKYNFILYIIYVLLIKRNYIEALFLIYNLFN